MISIVAFLDRVLSLIQVYLKKIQDKRAQDERDKLENDPFDFYVHHFDGVSDTSSQTKADKADSNHPA